MTSLHRFGELWYNETYHKLPPELREAVDHQGKVIESFLLQEIARGKEEVVESMKIKLNSVYTEFENKTPPVSFMQEEISYNAGLYQGRLNAMEEVAQKVFDTDGCSLTTLTEEK